MIETSNTHMEGNDRVRRSNLSRTPRPNLVIAVLAFSGMGAAFMSTILIPIQGRLPELLGTSSSETAWLITITLLVSAVSTPICGRLGDMYGKRRVALVLLLLMVAGSVLAALSQTVVPLIIGRGLQGTGLGVIPLGIAMLRDNLHKDRLGSAIALVSATLGVGGALGLPLSAIVTANFDWHVLFWIAAGIGAISFVLVLLVIPASTLRSLGRIDLVGALGLAVGISSMLIALSRGNEWGWGAPLTLALLGGSITVFAFWGWFELRQQNPLVDLRAAGRGPVLMTNLASIAIGFALFASSIAFPQLLQLPTEVGGLGLDLLPASLILMPMGLTMLAISPVAGRLERRIGPKPLLVTAGVIIAAAYLASMLIDLTAWSILLINVLIGIGTGMGYAAIPTLIMQAVPANETAAANALNTLMRTFGTAVAAALIAAVLTQATTVVNGGLVPSAHGFQLAFLLGFISAIVAAVLAIAIPRAKGFFEPGKTVSTRRSPAATVDRSEARQPVAGPPDPPSGLTSIHR